jgi:type 1 glutamine amidotransferase
MKRFLKILLWTVLSIIVVLGVLMTGFIYKIKNGFPVSFETDAPAIDFPQGRKSVLLFSKATGFRHGESIDAGKKVFAELATKNNWFLYETEEGGAFNPEQLAKFDVVIFSNSTGRVLSDDQQRALEDYVTQGGSLIGIHGSGDNSHHWDWYTQNLMGAEFSHHALDPHLQEATVTLNNVPDSLLVAGLPPSFTQTDEWYVFFDNPRAKGFNIVYAIDGEKIIPNGNMLWMKDKNFGMGKDHPVAWYRATGKGRTFYTSMGHDATAWAQAPFVKMLENAVNTK